MHIHVGALSALIFLAYLLIIGFFIRTVTARFPDSKVAQGLAFIY